MRTRSRILLVALAGLVLAAAAAVVAYLQSRSFAELARAALERRASAATGLQCRVRSLRLDVLRLRFEIRGFELAPAPGTPHPIELTVDEIEGRLQLLSLWRFKVNLTADRRFTAPAAGVLALGALAGAAVAVGFTQPLY